MSRFGSKEEEALIEAVRAVSRAEILPRFRALGRAEVDSKSAPDDLVTIADKAAEHAIGARVAEILPSARIIGEEAVATDASLLDGIAHPGLTVIIDPIDGTWNYANGLSTFGVILAVVEDGETILGLLYDPSGDDWIVARKGDGAWYDGVNRTAERLAASAAPPRLDETMGFVGLYLYGKADQARIAATLPEFRRTYSLRCSCHEYRMMAQGRADFVLNGMLNPWDHAAGVLALEEAGGVARLLDGTPYRPTMTDGLLLTAGNAALWDRLADLWAPLNRS